MSDNANSLARPRRAAELGCAAALIGVFVAVVAWFDIVDFYHQHFFDHGILVAADNLARVGFLLVLSWLIYVPGAAVLRLVQPDAGQSLATPLERGVLGFGVGVGLWHLLLLILGVAGLYYRSAMVGLAAIVVLASARHFGVAASAACRALVGRAAALRRGETIPEAISIGLIAIFAVWLLLVRGLYPGGAGDYYTHYFYYYLDVLNNHGLAPNDVWYHYYYSKGYGLFFFGMLLSDPEAPALVTFCCVVFAAVAMAALANRIAPRSLWPGCVGGLYLLSNLISYVRDGGGEFQKDHELVSALVAVIACAMCMRRRFAGRCWLAMAASCGVAIAIIAQPMGIVVAAYFMLAAMWATLRRRWREMLQYASVGAAIGGTVAAVLALNYWQTGLASDQGLGLMLRFANIARLDRLGLLPQIVIVSWIRDNYAIFAPSSGWELVALLRKFTRFDQVWVFLAGSAVALGFPATRAIASRLRQATGKPAPARPRPAFGGATIGDLGALVATLAAISVIAGRRQPVSFDRASTFFLPLLLLLGMAVGGGASARTPARWERWALGWLLPLLISSGTVFVWGTNDDWTPRLAKASENGLRFLAGGYSLADAYSRQDSGFSFGGINPHALAAWRQVEPDAAIWSTNVDSYCMVPGCRIESSVSFPMSGKLDEIVSGSPERAKELLQQAKLNFFLVSEDSHLIDLLPYSKLFAPDTIGRYLGIKWTDGSAFLLTWLGPDTTPLTPQFLRIYKQLLEQPPQNRWFLFSQLAPQIEAATAVLRAKPWGRPAEFAWRIPPAPPPDGTIDVAEATYGWSCLFYWPRTGAINTVAEGNATRAVRESCSGKAQCVFKVDVAELRDPAQACSKDFSVAYRCAQGDPLTVVKIPAEANGKSVSLACLTPPPDGTINVVEATYGQSCASYWPKASAANTVAEGNATRALRASCSGKPQCVFKVDVTKLGDPAQGCSKDFSVAYRCAQGDPLTLVKILGEANGKLMSLSCLAPP